ncbi:N-acetylglucosaminyltransferase [Gracilaria domingensis]|nr:N-acetylglucosaminyltransferase [Gracilaria domingensis]
MPDEGIARAEFTVSSSALQTVRNNSGSMHIEYSFQIDTSTIIGGSHSGSRRDGTGIPHPGEQRQSGAAAAAAVAHPPRAQRLRRAHRRRSAARGAAARAPRATGVQRELGAQRAEHTRAVRDVPPHLHGAQHARCHAAAAGAPPPLALPHQSQRRRLPAAAPAPHAPRAGAVRPAPAVVPHAERARVVGAHARRTFAALALRPRAVVRRRRRRRAAARAARCGEPGRALERAAVRVGRGVDGGVVPAMRRPHGRGAGAPASGPVRRVGRRHRALLRHAGHRAPGAPAARRAARAALRALGARPPRAEPAPGGRRRGGAPDVPPAARRAAGRAQPVYLQRT